MSIFYVDSFKLYSKAYKINGRAIKSLSDYGMGIYLLCRTIKYLFYFGFIVFVELNFWFLEFGQAIIYFSRI